MASQDLVSKIGYRLIRQEKSNGYKEEAANYEKRHGHEFNSSFCHGI